MVDFVRLDPNHVISAQVMNEAISNAKQLYEQAQPLESLHLNESNKQEIQDEIKARKSEIRLTRNAGVLANMIVESQLFSADCLPPTNDVSYSGKLFAYLVFSELQNQVPGLSNLVEQTMREREVVNPKVTSNTAIELSLSRSGLVS